MKMKKQIQNEYFVLIFIKKFILWARTILFQWNKICKYIHENGQNMSKTNILVNIYIYISSKSL